MRLKHKASRSDKKLLRSQRVQKLRVVVENLPFDGDETSQQRMALRAQRMRANGQETIRWILADNTEANVTAEQLEQAVDLALQAQSKLWLI